MSPWLEATRPRTLTAALVPIVVGTCLARAEGLLGRPALSVFALLSAILIQIGTNLVNDAIDFRKGADREDRQGPRRVTQGGLISGGTVLRGGLACFGLAALLGIPLLLQGGWPILGIGVVSLLCGYAYTGGPFPLAYLGLGELFVLLFFGFAATGGVYLLQAGQVDSLAWLAGGQVGLLATTLIAINNLRDAHGDRTCGKRTLAVRFGLRFGRTEIALLCLAPYFLGAGWIQAGKPWAALLPCLTLPLAARITLDVARTAPGKAYNGFLARSALLHLSFGLLLSLGLLLSQSGT